MVGSVRLQEWIHRLEVGAGARYLRWILAIVAFAMLAVIYDALCFQNFRSPEAMDAGQLARNIAEGKGCVTSCVRPLSLALLREHGAGKASWVKEGYPDISNAPVYPFLLAGLFRLTPKPGDMTVVKRFRISPPDLFVAVLNQFLMGVGALLVFRLALRWFDQVVAWTSAFLFAATELYWRFSISGLSTMLLLDEVLFLAWLLSRFEQAAREGGAPGKVFGYALAVGLTIGVATLTRYSIGWLMIPVLAFVGCCAVQKRTALVLCTFCAFALVVAPWVMRNMSLSGWPFGTATLAVLQDTRTFPADTLERSLAPIFSGMPGYGEEMFHDVLNKGLANMRDIVTSEVPRMGGTWLSAFFLAGLLLRFRNVNLSRMRWFTVGAIAVMIPVQAWSRTDLSNESPVLSGDNLLVVLSPLLIILGVGIFFVLLESLDVPSRAIRYAVIASFTGLMALPLILALVPPYPKASAPPYYAPRIQQVARYVGKGELWMSDIPWALAWYGERECVGLPLSWDRDFLAINQQKTVNGLFISTRTTDRKFFSSWYAGENWGWGTFLLRGFVRHEIPDGFPLKKSPEGLFANGELLLMDRDRWTTVEKGKKD
jgi:4-amino-4-deoxy-L-arabinose transferase-like glycosyltransferase